MKKSQIRKLIREILEEQVPIKKQPRPHKKGPSIKRPNKPVKPKHSPNVGLGGVPPMPKRGGGDDPVGKHPGRGRKRGCLDDTAVNYCSDCGNDCANTPIVPDDGWEGPWGMFPGNPEDIGDTSCCEYSDINNEEEVYCNDNNACNFNPTPHSFLGMFSDDDGSDCEYCYMNDCTIYPSDEFDCDGMTVNWAPWGLGPGDEE